MTPVREKVLEFLADQDVPVSRHAISASAEFAREFDRDTIYRTLLLMVELEIVREVQLRDQGTFYTLNEPHACFVFLVCRSCGAVTRVKHADATKLIEKEIAAQHGFSGLTHQLVMYGVCPVCSEQLSKICKVGNEQLTR